MTKEEIKSTEDFEAYIAEAEADYCNLIDKWIADGPTYKREKIITLANKLLDNKLVNDEEYGLLLECSQFVPKAGDGSLNLSFSLAPAAEDPEYKGYIAKVMAMMSFFGHAD